MQTLHILTHAGFEGPGRIVDWAAGRGIAIQQHDLHAGAKVPEPGPEDGICIMGGPMNVYDDHSHPWLRTEREFLAACAMRSVPMLGICLGAQHLAVAHGGTVFPNPVREIGWMPVELFPAPGLPPVPASAIVLHWHGDTFSLPSGARHLGRSQFCENQAFVAGRSLGLQFHLEAGDSECEAFLANASEDLDAPGETIQTAAAIRLGSSQHAPVAAGILFQLLDWHFLGVRQARRPPDSCGL